MSERIGSGTMVGDDTGAEGVFTALLDVEDLLAVMDGGVVGLVAYLVHPNVTMMGPIYDSLTAIVCEHGDDTSHVAIVAREFGIPCSVKTTIEPDIASLKGRRVRLTQSGELFLLD